MQSSSVLRVLWPQPGARLSLPPSCPAALGHLCVSICTANQGSRCARQPSRAGWAGQKSCLDWREADDRPGACSPASTWWNFRAPRGENERSNRQEGSQNWKGTEDGTGRNGVSRTSLSGFTRTQRANWRDRTGCLLLGSLGGRQSFVAPITQAGSGRSWASFAVAMPEERAPTPRVRLPGPGAQTSLPRTARRGSLESCFKTSYRLRQHTHGTYSAQRPNPRGEPRSSPTLEEETRTGGGTGK